MVNEDPAKAEIYKNGAAEVPEVARRFKPARSFCIKFARLQELVILIRSELSHLFQPAWCKGGLAFWTRILVKEWEKEQLQRKALSHKVYIIDPDRFSTGTERYTRLGFASMNKEEVGEAVEVLKELVAD